MDFGIPVVAGPEGIHEAMSPDVVVACPFTTARGASPGGQEPQNSSDPVCTAFNPVKPRFVSESSLHGSWNRCPIVGEALFTILDLG
jgi:hypothetical protein